MSATFLHSLAIDRRLFRQEIRASIAHCDGLFRAGIATKIEAERLKNGLWTILKRADFDSHYFTGLDAPDIFAFIEARLYQLINEAAFQLRIGRSRVHAAAAALRLWLREEVELIIELLDDLHETLQKKREHDFIARQIQCFLRDEARFQRVLQSINKMPCPLADPLDEAAAEIDFHLIARELGFETVVENTLDGAHDRDFCLDYSNACVAAMLHLKNLTSELAESLPNNVDRQQVFAKIRGKTAQIIGNHTALLTILTYQLAGVDDEQVEVSKIIFETTDVFKSCLQAVVHSSN